MDETTEVMHIRIPKDLAAKVREVSKQENTRLGTALKFLIEQGANERLETRLTCLEEIIGKMLKGISSLATLEAYYITDRLVAKVQEEGMSPDLRKLLENIKGRFEQLDETENTYYENICVLLEDSREHLT
jgi:hypothetical protein